MAGAGMGYPPRWAGWPMALAGFALALPFFPLWSRRLMGAGDVKAIAILGLLAGFAPLVMTLVAASLLAGLHALSYLFLSRSRALPLRARQTPYGAYLALLRSAWRLFP